MAKVKIDFATADKIYPLSYTRNKITECAFASRRVINNKPMLYVSIHRKATDQDEITTGNYMVENYLFKINRGGNLVDVTDSLTDIIRVIDTGDIVPWFSILKPNITNNIDMDNPMGVSVFGNSIDVLKGLDIAYDSLINEFILGRKRIFVEDDLLQPDATTGQFKKIFDTNDVVFHSLPGSNTGDNAGKKITESDMELRIEEHEKGIQQNLNILSSKVGFGQKYYDFNQGSVQTATQIVSENSDLFRNIKKHEILIEECLRDLFKGIFSMMSNFLSINIPIDTEVSINFDDSIIEDTAETKRQAQLEYNLGLIDKVMYFMMTRKLDEEQAKQLVEEIEGRMPTEPEPTQEGNEE